MAVRCLGVLLFVSGCGASTSEQELKALRESIRAMQAQMARLDERVEALSHRVAVSSAPPRSAQSAPALEVVRLEPAAAAAKSAPAPEPEPEDNGPVVEIKLDESSGVPALAVVDVPPHPPETDRGAADRLFKRALEAYQAGRAAEAYGHFQSFVKDHPKHEHAGNAQYWMGECQLELGKLDAAIADLSRVVDRYPRSSKAPDAVMKMGIAYERQGKSDAARRSFLRVIDSYPDSALADLARARLAAR
jgi:tol-pal system protein YbgF